MIRRPAASSCSSHDCARPGSSISTSISSTGPGAPPWSGPFNAPIAPEAALTMSERVLAITRAVNVDAFMPWSITVTQ